MIKKMQRKLTALQGCRSSCKTSAIPHEICYFCEARFIHGVQYICMVRYIHRVRFPGNRYIRRISKICIPGVLYISEGFLISARFLTLVTGFIAAVGLM